MRTRELDILRGIAVLLVLFRHSDLSHNILMKFGWLGVDLFFVLSGYLISNLLFSEFKKKGSVNFKRFAIRRSFKILPSFYIFVIISLTIFAFQGKLDFRWDQYTSEVLYLQTYVSRIWLHTWSLGVEQHFYISFAIILLFLIKKGYVENTKHIITALLLMLVLSFVMRFISSYPHRNQEVYSFMQTHLRFDGILVGILISYLVNFTQITTHIKRFYWMLVPISIGLILPAFFFAGGSYFMNTIGLSIVNLGFGILLLLTLLSSEVFTINNRIITSLSIPISFIGAKSYSIYLWHLQAKELNAYLFSFDATTNNYIYILLAIILGSLMWYVVERPFDRLRERF